MGNLTKLSTLLIVVAAFIWIGCASTKTATTKTTAPEAAASYAGDWDYTVADTPNGDVSGVMVLTKTDAGYEGKMTSDMGELLLNNLKIVENKLTATFEVQGMELEVDGTFEGTSYTGTVGLDYNVFPMKATKK